MPGFNVEMLGGAVVRIDAEDEESAMRAARDQGVPTGIKKPAVKKASSSTTKKAAPKKAAPKRKR